MKKLFYFVAAMIILSGCNFSKSVKIDLISGLTTSGNLLSCEDVSVIINRTKAESSTFSYGQKISVYFNGVKGMKMESDKIFPWLDMFVLNTKGDTVFKSNDLYSQYSEGLTLSPVQLSAKLTLAKPIHSGQDYVLYVNLKDKKGEGTFHVKLSLKVVPDANLKSESSKSTCGEMYLFSKNSGETITDGKVRKGDTVYLLLEGLNGFQLSDGKVYPGLSLVATAKDGKEIFKSDDLFSDYSVKGINAADFNQQVMASLTFPEGDVANPVNCEYVLWDKKSDAKLKVTTSLNIY